MAVIRTLAGFAAWTLTVMFTASMFAPGYQARGRTSAPTVQAEPQMVPILLPAMPTRQRPVKLDDSPVPRRAILTEPADAQVRAGVVVVHGAGSGDASGVSQLADALARRGVAVLSADKRDDDYSFLHRDLTMLADDAVDQADWLRAHLPLNLPIALLGISEGGWVAPLAASHRPRSVDALILLGAPVVTPLEQSAHIVASNTPGVLHRFTTGVLASGRRLVNFLDYDVRPYLDQPVPILAVFGEQDPLVPVSQAVTRLQAASSEPVSVIVVREAGHSPPPGVWTEQTAAWLLGGQPYLGIVGDPGTESRSAPRPPDQIWYLDPFAQFALSLALTLVTWGFFRHRGSVSRRKPPSPERLGS